MLHLLYWSHPLFSVEQAVTILKHRRVTGLFTTPKLLEAIDRVGQARQRRVTTGALNKFVSEITAAHPPVSPGRKHVRIMYAAQTGVAPPSFVFFTNVATTFHFSYQRFLVNQLREAFGFEGTPIRVHVRRRAPGTGDGKRSGRGE